VPLERPHRNYDQASHPDLVSCLFIAIFSLLCVAAIVFILMKSGVI